MSSSLVKLEDVLIVNPDSYSKKNGQGILRYLDTANITAGKVDEIVIFDPNSDKIPSRARRLVQNGDIVYSTVRPNQLHYGVLKKIPENLVVSTGFVVLRSKFPSEYNTTYIFYLITQKHLTNYLHGIAENNASAYPSLRPQDLLHLEFEFPSIEEQKRVVGFISAIDDKIELNRQTNQTLEAIAQTIFKSWFVDFEPTRAKLKAKQNGQDPERAAMAAISGKTVEQLDQLSPEQQQQLKTTAALFPDALEDSELGEIPKGWNIKEIKELSSKISKGTTPRKADMQKAEDAEIIAFLKVRNISDDGEITRIGLDKIPESVHSGVLKRSILETNDMLFSIAGTIGRVAFVEKDLSNSNCNQAVAFIRLEEPEKYLELCRLNLVGNRVQDEVVSKVVQGVQANFSLAGLGEIKILIPTEKFIAYFNQIVGDISCKQRLLLSENRKLAELRDTLLPKLLSGELDTSIKDVA